VFEVSCWGVSESTVGALAIALKAVVVVVIMVETVVGEGGGGGGGGGLVRIKVGVMEVQVWCLPRCTPTAIGMAERSARNGCVNHCMNTRRCVSK
jgi:hypothetical protein